LEAQEKAAAEEAAKKEAERLERLNAERIARAEKRLADQRAAEKAAFEAEQKAAAAEKAAAEKAAREVKAAEERAAKEEAARVAAEEKAAAKAAAEEAKAAEKAAREAAAAEEKAAKEEAARVAAEEKAAAKAAAEAKAAEEKAAKEEAARKAAEEKAAEKAARDAKAAEEKAAKEEAARKAAAEKAAAQEKAAAEKAAREAKAAEERAAAEAKKAAEKAAAAEQAAAEKAAQEALEAEIKAKEEAARVKVQAELEARREALRTANSLKALVDTSAPAVSALDEKPVEELLKAAVPKVAPTVPAPKRAEPAPAPKAQAPAAPTAAPSIETLDVSGYDSNVENRKAIVKPNTVTIKERQKYQLSNPRQPGSSDTFGDFKLPSPVDFFSKREGDENIKTWDQFVESRFKVSNPVKSNAVYKPKESRVKKDKPATEQDATNAVAVALAATGSALGALVKAASPAIEALPGTAAGAVDAAVKFAPEIPNAAVGTVEHVFELFEKIIETVYKVVPDDKEPLGAGQVAAVLTALTFGYPLAVLYEARYGGYAGDFRAKRVQELLRTSNAILVDIRRAEERQQDGVPDLRRSARGKIVPVPPAELETYVKRQVMDTSEIELNKQSFTIASLKQVKDASRVIIMDKNGRNSIALAKKLREMGIERPYTMSGGYNAWLRSGLRTKRDYETEITELLQEELEALAEDDDNIIGVINGLLSTDEGRILLAGRLGLGLGAAYLLFDNIQLLLELSLAGGVAKYGIDKIRGVTDYADPPDSPQSTFEKLIEQASDITQRAIEFEDDIIRATTGIKIGREEPPKPGFKLPELPSVPKPTSTQRTSRSSSPPRGTTKTLQSRRSNTPPRR